MNENPFDQSTLRETGTAPQPVSNTLSTGDGVEVRYPAAQRTLVPALLASTAVIAPLILFFVLQPPLNFVVSAAVAVMEFGTAGFMWFLFNSAFVRADSNGVSKSQFGKTGAARWEEIARMETVKVENQSTQIILKDSSGREVLSVSDLSNKRDGERLIAYIAEKLEQK
jgi:hypothetical protein